MQFELIALDWSQFTRFDDASAFAEWRAGLDDETELHRVPAESTDSDSFSHYMEVAWALQHLTKICTPAMALHLREGILRILAENGHIDECGASDLTDNVYWISASPASAVKIKTHIDALDLPECVALLTANPSPDAECIMNNVEEDFVAFIRQHARIVDAAVSRGYGLIGTCG